MPTRMRALYCAFAALGLATAAPVIIVLKNFFMAVPIPTTLKPPCGGNGVVCFVPIPTSATARGVAVNAIFENLAV